MRRGHTWRFLAFDFAWFVVTVNAALVYNPDKQAAFWSANISQTLRPVDIGDSQLEWSFTAEPSVNSTGHLIFSTVSSFLQHWPNTRYQNGHSIIPATLPIGTLLYHGTFKPEIPLVPEWTAVDPEHSYLFCRADFPIPNASAKTADSNSASACWHLTLTTTRPLKLLYFDGSSAAKMRHGSMDSQDLIVWGEVKPEWAGLERKRIEDLCEWGKGYELDGFVRMEMDFEIMLCDFSSGVKPVSFLNLVPVNSGGEKIGSTSNLKDPEPPEPVPDVPEKFRSLTSPAFRVMEAGGWANHFPGDTRIHLDYARLISFYDLALFPSLQVARKGQTRLEHRLEGISTKDVGHLKERLDEILGKDAENSGSGSGIDWQSLIKVVTNRYAERLEILHYILNSSSITPAQAGEANSTLKQAHRHVTSMIIPYILHSAVPPFRGRSDLPVQSVSANYSWALPVWKLCASTHTDYIETDLEPEGNLTPSEQLLLSAVKGVTKEICRVLVEVWAEGVKLGLAEAGNIALEVPFDSDLLDTESVSSNSIPQKLVDRWKSKVEMLMAWLDWSYWLRCRPACSYEEMCYLPTWPAFSRSLPPSSSDSDAADGIQGKLDKDEEGGGDEGGNWDEEKWVDRDPRPRCIRRVEPLPWGDFS